jgi:Cu(I)/Ag(I) efflux system protein CusF
MKKITPVAIVWLLSALAGPALARQPAADHSPHPAVVAQNSASMTEGEVRRVDKDAGKLTIRHGPIRNLEMPAMTMVFQVKDAAMLDKVNVGDKVQFNAERIPGGFTVTEIETVK